MTAHTEHDREALVKLLRECKSLLDGYNLNGLHTPTIRRIDAALTAQGGEQTAVAWLICRADGSRDVVLSPLTDDTPMDYGDEAWPLVHQSSMPDSTDGQTADTVSVPTNEPLKLLFTETSIYVETQTKHPTLPGRIALKIDQEQADYIKQVILAFNKSQFGATEADIRRWNSLSTAAAKEGKS